MPIVRGNEPRQPQRRAGGATLGWIIPLIIFGPTIYRVIRNASAGLLTDQQLAVAAGGAVAFGVMVWVIQRVNRARASNPARLPTAYELPKAAVPPTSQAGGPSIDQAYVPQSPRYEPIITGKVVLAGVVLAALMAGLGLLLAAL